MPSFFVYDIIIIGEFMRIEIDLKLFNWNDTVNHCRYNKYSANNIKKKEMQDPNRTKFINSLKAIIDAVIETNNE